MTVTYDIDQVDWLAVKFVCEGTPMRLSGDVPTMAAVLARIGYDLPVDQLAERMGTTVRQIGRILTTKLGAKHCPLCRRCLILDGDVAPRHVNSNNRVCRMSGYSVHDQQRIAAILHDRAVIGKCV